jgi:hypothetical protein
MVVVVLLWRNRSRICSGSGGGSRSCSGRVSVGSSSNRVAVVVIL